MDTNQIQVTATFPAIPAARLPEFKGLAAKAMEQTKTEVGSLQYDWFFNADETLCIVREAYADSDAVLAHMGNLGSLLGELMEIGGGLGVEVFGTPSASLLEAAAALQPQVFKPFQGK